MTYKEINHTDSDGNTGLHIACIQDNYDLVQLFLQSDTGKVVCSRTILNKQSLNAYECAQSDRVRSLFARPVSTDNHFVDTNSNSSSSQVMQVPQTMYDQGEIAIPNNSWTRGYMSRENTIDAQFFLGISRVPWLFRKLFKLRIEPEACEIVRNIIRRASKDNRTYEGLMKEFNRFIQTKNAEHLLTLYTKEIEFCRILQMENNAFTTLLYLYLKKLAHCSFGPGESFRGLVFVDSNQYQAVIKDYLWAKQNDEYILETRVFQSTSKDRAIADMYMESFRSSNEPSLTVLCHYHFPNKCFTAFDFQNISIFPAEQEVLILPFTLFKVINIEMVSSNYYIISLMNVPTPEMSVRNVRRKMKTFRVNSNQVSADLQ